MATSGTITFEVTHNLKRCETQHNQSMNFSSADLDRWSKKSNREIKEILSFENGQTNYPLIQDLPHRVKNAFVATVFQAYCNHYPLELSVEDFWVAITQGVSIHLNKNAEKYRNLLVEHEEKKTLILPVDSLRIPESDRPPNGNKSIPAINWPLAVRQMCQLIQNDMKADLTTLITKRFSNTTDIEGTVFDCTLMESVKSYYSYRCSLTCGIPEVTLRGLPSDFQDLINRVQQLKTYFIDFHWWLDTILPHLEKLKESAEGKADIDWWQRICHRDNNMSGVDLLLGWLADFIPYKSNKNGGYVEARHYSKRNMTNGIDFGDLEESVTQTDFVLDDNGHHIDMKLIAGFLGLGQNPSTGALRPCLGWITVLPSVKEIPPVYLILFKNNIPDSEMLKIKQNIINEGGSIINEFTLIKCLVATLGKHSMSWIEQHQYFRSAELDRPM